MINRAAEITTQETYLFYFMVYECFVIIASKDFI